MQITYPSNLKKSAFSGPSLALLWFNLDLSKELYYGNSSFSLERKTKILFTVLRKTEASRKEWTPYLTN